MGHRLSKIYTRTGDSGNTGLGNGTRIDKDSPRITAIGEVDELNSIIGMILSQDISTPVRNCLSECQHRLFDLGGELCMPGHQMISTEHVSQLENDLDTFNAELPALKEFILPGGTPAAAHCHHARTVCRRAERNVVSLHRDEPLNPELMAYLNRLSDLLFVIARLLARADGNQEVLWQNPTKAPPPA